MDTAAPRHPAPDANARAAMLWGTAYGDATGALTEFESHRRIVATHGPDGPPPLHGYVTDDTQMTLALDDALRATVGGTPARVRAAVLREFLAWLDDPDNNRAPGNTCLEALRRLQGVVGGGGDAALDAVAADGSWSTASVLRSKGCGTVMRAAPAAFLPEHLVDPVAAFQGAVTHGHPTGVAAGILTARAVRAAALGEDPLEAALALARAGATEPAEETAWAGDGWLGGIPAAAGFERVADYLAAGYAECVGPLAAAQDARGVPGGDPADVSGEGWVAEECLASGLLAWAWHPGDPVAAIRRAAASGGDSDSIAAITGAVAGAAAGAAAWPPEWQERIEPRYRDWLRAAAAGAVV